MSEFFSKHKRKINIFLFSMVLINSIRIIVEVMNLKFIMFGFSFWMMTWGIVLWVIFQIMYME